MNRIALNEGTIPVLPLEEKIKVASSAGYEGIGICMPSLQEYLDRGHTFEELKEQLEESNLEVVELDYLRDWLFTTGASKKESIKNAKNLCKIAKQVKSKCILAAAFGYSEDISLGVKNLKGLSEIAQDYGVNVAFEFLPWEQINNMSLSWNIVEKANMDNCGILIDTFHFFKGNSSLTDFDHIPIEKIQLIHMSDFPEINGDYDLLTQTLDFRVFPGEGIFDLKGFVNKLIKYDYKGYYSMEVLNKNFKDKNPIDIAKAGITSLNTLFKQLHI